ncbi:MAG: hypothetical protein ACK5LZ_01280 [Anaerorhabdus sp.]
MKVSEENPYYKIYNQFIKDFKMVSTLTTTEISQLESMRMMMIACEEHEELMEYFKNVDPMDSPIHIWTDEDENNPMVR